MEAIIFDVDGTLWDSTDQVAIAWNEVLKEEKMDLVLTGDELKKLFGKPLPEIMEIVFPERTREEQDDIARKLFLKENAWVSHAPCILYPGLCETMEQLSKKYRLFIVSNCQAGYIEAFLENTGLGDCFVDYTCPGDTDMFKADNIKFMLRKYGLNDAVYVGDTQGDEQACVEAEIPMIYAAYGFGQVEQEHVSIQSLTQLEQAIKLIEK